MPKQATIFRGKARAVGHRFYFTGVPCAKGHICKRWTSNAQCYECKKLRVRDAYARHRGARNKWNMVANAKQRAKRLGLPFDISVQDVINVWPSDDCCPVFHVPFAHGLGKQVPESPSLDRIKPYLGYIKGNIAVISSRANRVKSEETDPSALLKVANWMREQR